MEKIITKEFLAADTGKRVGWVSVEPVPDKETHYPGMGLINVNIVTATIGENGAQHGYHSGNQSERLHSSFDSEGFVAIAGLQMFVKQATPYSIDSMPHFNTTHKDDRDAHAILLYGTGPSSVAPVDENKQWFDNPNDLMSALKSKMSEVGVAQDYPAAYYYFNGLQFDKMDMAGLGSSDIDPQTVFAADPSMAEFTSEQLSHASDLLSVYSAAQQEDARMVKKLTVFSDISAEEVPAAFIGSRNQVHELEMSILAIVPSFAAPRLFYLPPSTYRSWPYMDASTSNENSAYGSELAGLRAGNIWLASHELTREIQSLHKRYDFANRGHQALHSLSLVEQSVA